MAQLRQDYPLFKERDTVVVAVGPEDRENFSKYWIENDMPFTGIPDPKHKIAEMYGQEVSITKLGRMPAQMVIDKKGILRYVHYGRSMKDIPENEEILAVLDGIRAVP